MSYGINAINSSNYIQIDQDYSNYAVLESGTATTSTKYLRPTLDPRAILFVSPMDFDGEVFYMDLYRSDGSTYYPPDTKMPADSWGIFSWQTVGDTDYTFGFVGNIWTRQVPFKYLWLLPSYLVPESADSHGMQVYKSDGALAYTTRQKTLRVLASWNPVLDAENFSRLILPASSKPRYVSVASTKIFNVTSTPGETVFSCMGIKFMNANNIRCRYMEWSGYANGALPDTSSPYGQHRHILVTEY